MSSGAPNEPSEGLCAGSEAPSMPGGAVFTDRIRVLHLIHTMAYGGVETTVINWLRKIDRTRFEVHLGCFANPGATEAPFVEAAEAAGLTVPLRIPWRRTKPVLAAARRLRDYIRSQRIEIVHSHNCYADVVARLAQMFIPVKFATTLYVWGDFGWKRNLIQWVNGVAIRRFDLISAHCQDARDQTIARGFAPDKVKLLISGFESDRCTLSAGERRRRRQEQGVGEGDVLLVNVARFYPEKVHDTLLRVFREVSARHPEARLWLLGVGPLEGELRRLTRELGLEEKVRFLGFVRDMAPVLALADMQVHPSKMEGVPLAVCAGMAAGLPIVASAVGGLREVLKNEATGVLVPAGDERGFTEAVLGLIEQPERRRRLGEGARRFIENDYSLQRAAQGLEQAYLEVLGRCG